MSLLWPPYKLRGNRSPSSRFALAFGVSANGLSYSTTRASSLLGMAVGAPESSPDTTRGSGRTMLQGGRAWFWKARVAPSRDRPRSSEGGVSPHGVCGNGVTVSELRLQLGSRQGSKTQAWNTPRRIEHPDVLFTSPRWLIGQNHSWELIRETIRPVYHQTSTVGCPRTDSSIEIVESAYISGFSKLAHDPHTPPKHLVRKREVRCEGVSVWEGVGGRGFLL